MSVTFSPAPCRLDTIVDECLSAAAETLSARGIGVNRQYEADLPEYPLDRALVREAVGIMLQAAIDCVEPPRGIRVTLRFNRNALMFAIKSPGEGMPDSQREAIFGGEPDPGTLARARQCIRAHGGVAWANGSPGRGITWYFTLPARRSD